MISNEKQGIKNEIDTSKLSLRQRLTFYLYSTNYCAELVLLHLN